MKNLITMTVLASTLIAGTAFAGTPGVAALFDGDNLGSTVLAAFTTGADELPEVANLNVSFTGDDPYTGTITFVRPLPLTTFKTAAQSALEALNDQDSGSRWVLSKVSSTEYSFKDETGDDIQVRLLGGKKIDWDIKLKP